MFMVPLPSDALQPQWQAEFRARVGAPLLDRTHGMRGNARNTFGLCPGRPRWRVHDSCSRVRRQFIDRHGFAAGGIGSDDDFRILSNAHRSPWLLNLALLADTIRCANSYVNSRSGKFVLMHTSRISVRPMHPNLENGPKWLWTNHPHSHIFEPI